MADGSVGLQEIDQRTLLGMGKGYAYLPPLAGQLVVQPGRIGACDPLQGDERARLHWCRYGTVGVRFRRDAVTGDLVAALADSTALQAFQNAPTQSAAGSGLPFANFTAADTNAEQQGGVVKGNAAFVTVGFRVDFEEPYLVTAGTTTSAEVISAPWAQAYRDEAMAQLMAQLSTVVQHGTNTACQYDLGAIGTWCPSAARGMLAGNTVPGEFFMLAVPDVSGSQNVAQQLLLTATLQRQIRLQNDPLNATVIGFDLIVPVRVLMAGFPTCDPSLTQTCGTDARMDALTEKLNALTEIVAAAMDDDPPPQTKQLGDGGSPKAGGALRRLLGRRR